MDEILIKAIKQELNENYSKSDADQLFNFIDNYFTQELSKEEKNDIVEGVLDIKPKQTNED